MLDGELEVTIEGEVLVAGPGMVAVVPAGARHSVRAHGGKAIVADHPVRTGF